MATGTLSVVASIGGATLQKTISETFDHPNTYEGIVMTAGIAVTDGSYVYAAADNCAGNVAGGHGITNGAIDVYWTAGLRYDCNAVVTGNALVITGGTGDNFPANNTNSVVVCEPEQVNTAIDGDEVQLMVINATKRGSVDFEDGADGVIKQIELAADTPYTYAQSGGETSPFTGDPITVCFYSNGTTTAGVLTILSGEDSTP